MRWLIEKTGSPGEYITHYSEAPVLAGMSVSMDAQGRTVIAASGTQAVEIRAGNGQHSLYEGMTLTVFTTPFNGVWKSWRILAPWDTTTDIEIDLYRDTYANWPPTAADSVCGASKITIVSASKNEGLTGSWTDNTFAAGDVFLIHVDSTADPGPLGVVLQLAYTRTS